MKKIPSLLLLVLLLACSHSSPMNKVQLQKYLNDEANGLTQTEQIKDFQVQVTYRPTDLLVEQEIGSELANVNKLAELRKKYANTDYFLLSISRDGKEALNPQADFQGYSELVQTLSFRMGEFVQLTTSQGDTIPVGDYAFQRTYGMASSSQLLFAFPKGQGKAGTEWIQFNLNEFGLGAGSLRFQFRREDLEEIPPLDFGSLGPS